MKGAVAMSLLVAHALVSVASASVVETASTQTISPQAKQATAQKPVYSYQPATIECVIAAAERQGVPANVLLGIASIEMGANGDRLKNTNKSVDLGHFGINTIHFRPGEPLANAGIRAEDVATRGCYNAEIAAWLLARRLREQRGADFWVWAANYHSATPTYNAIYRKKLIKYSEQWSRWLQYRYPQVSIYQPHPKGNQQ